ncbi:hypothetical protein AV654_07650 [Paenibacillus elgii]|uniref:HTH rpiR-type domain-containing protein n=1 Tax=Paenibacillus elgii TaxID=189691 RepID=A0A164AAF8_9BACL|nr:MurR/RpiR family transcriptional regulator [Paenibacillus elgii]KZE83444.1 hypothetical protein AV654_07650 [Paenibacillus elgii]
MSVERKIEQVFDSLSPSQKKAAYFLTKDIRQAAVLSAKKMGELAGVSEATVHRLAQTLGFEGYAALQSELQSQFLQARPVQRLLETAQEEQATWLDELFAQDIDNLRETAALKQEAKVEEAVRLLLGAERTYTAGWRVGLAVTAPLAYIMHYMLGQARLVPQGEAAEYAAHFRPGDVLLVSGFPRYCQTTRRLTEAAKEKGARIVALTDSPVSPFAKLADVYLLAATRSRGFLDSYVAPLALANALIKKMAQLDLERVKRNMVEMERKFRMFETESSGWTGPNGKGTTK